MDDEREQRLFELADLVLAVGRQIHAAKGPAAESWTPLESGVMRFIDRHPGTSARAAAEATHLISSNFSRAVRELERRGLVRRETDERDGRRVRLFPTELAGEHLADLHRLWSGLLDGIVTDPAELDGVLVTLRRVETELGARARGDDVRP